MRHPVGTLLDHGALSKRSYKQKPRLRYGASGGLPTVVFFRRNDASSNQFPVVTTVVFNPAADPASGVSARVMGSKGGTATCSGCVTIAFSPNCYRTLATPT